MPDSQEFRRFYFERKRKNELADSLSVEELKGIGYTEEEAQSILREIRK